MNSRRNTAEMTRTFGIEIEGYGLTQQIVANAITAAGVTCRVEGYGHKHSG